MSYFGLIPSELTEIIISYTLRLENEFDSIVLVLLSSNNYESFSNYSFWKNAANKNFPLIDVENAVSFDPLKKDPIYYLMTYYKLKKAYIDINSWINFWIIERDLKIKYITNFKLFQFNDITDYINVCKRYLNGKISHFYIEENGYYGHTIYFKEQKNDNK